MSGAWRSRHSFEKKGGKKRNHEKRECCCCRLISPGPRLSLLLPPTGLVLRPNLLITDATPVQFIDQLPGWLIECRDERKSQGHSKTCVIAPCWNPERKRNSLSLYLNFLLCVCPTCVTYRWWIEASALLQQGSVKDPKENRRRVSFWNKKEFRDRLIWGARLQSTCCINMSLLSDSVNWPSCYGAAAQGIKNKP